MSGKALSGVAGRVCPDGALCGVFTRGGPPSPAYQLLGGVLCFFCHGCKPSAKLSKEALNLLNGQGNWVLKRSLRKGGDPGLLR